MLHVVVCKGMVYPRYVEGYMLPRKQYTGYSSNAGESTIIWKAPKKFLKLQTKCHAWVEVYFEGFGWIH